MSVRRADTAGEYVDRVALETLRADLCGDERSVHRFMQDFVHLWASRVERLRDAMDRQFLDAAQVALLSIRASAQMLGALLLDAWAAGMLSAVGKADLPACENGFARLVELGEHTCRELGSMLPPGRIQSA